MSSSAKNETWIDRCFRSNSDADKPLDLFANVVTPENIAFNYLLAGPHRRFLAFLIDSILLTVVVVMTFLVGGLLLLWLSSYFAFFGTIAALLAAFWLVFALLLWWGYGAYCETKFNGQTLGKRLLRLRTVTTEGRPIHAGQSTLRNLIRFADLMPGVSVVLYMQWLAPLDTGGASPGIWPIPSALVALVLMSLTQRHQRLGDLVCGTMVVQEEPRWVADLTIADDPRTPALAEYIPPGFVVSRDMAKALAHYVDRRRYFIAARRSEIAKHLGEPLLKVFGMRADTSHDLILCALYYRTFVAAGEDLAAVDTKIDSEAAPQPPYQQTTDPANPLSTARWTPAGSPMEN